MDRHVHACSWGLGGHTEMCVHMYTGFGWSHVHTCTWSLGGHMYTNVHGVWVVTWVDMYTHVHGVWVVTQTGMYTCTGVWVVTHTYMYIGAWMSGCLGLWCDDVEGRMLASTPGDSPSFLSQGQRSCSPSRPSYLPQSLEELWGPGAVLETGRSCPKEEVPWVSNLCR